MTIGQRISSIRKSKNMSAEDLAKQIGVSPATIYRYENGDIEKIPAERLSAIADQLSTTTEILTGERLQYTSDELIDVYIRGAKKWADDCRFSEDQKDRITKFMADYVMNLKQTINAMANACQKNGFIAATADVNRSISTMKKWSSCALNYVNNDFSEEEKSPSELELTEGEKSLLELFRLIPVDRQPEALELLRVTLKMLQKP